MSTSDYRPAYDLLRALVTDHGSTMVFLQKGGSTGGSWFITVGNKHTYFAWRDFSFPGIDEFHIPIKFLPITYFDYKNELIPDAWEKLLENMKNETFYPSGDIDEGFDELYDY